MRVGTFEEYADKLHRDRREEDMCYQSIVTNDAAAAASLVERLRRDFSSFQWIALVVRLRNGFVTMENPETRLVHFAYHPTLHRPTVWWYQKEKRRTVKKEWDFWEQPKLSDPAGALPRDVLTYILSFCGVRDVLHMRSMSRAWRSAASNQSLWVSRFMCMNVMDQMPCAQSFIDYFFGFETDDQLKMVGRAWLHSIGQSPDVHLYTGGKQRVHLVEDMVPKLVERWVGTSPDATGVAAWVNFGKLLVKSIKSKSGYHTMPTKRWLIKYMLKYCDDVYEGRI